MSARSWWSAKADPKPAEKRENRSGEKPDLPIDDILDARIDEEGRLAQLGKEQSDRRAPRSRGRRQRASTSWISRCRSSRRGWRRSSGRAARVRRTRRAPESPAPPADGRRQMPSCGRDFVTYSLDRLEARLEALSRRLQQRAGRRHRLAPRQSRRSRRSPVGPSQLRGLSRHAAGARACRGVPMTALAAQLAESRRLADIEAAREESARQSGSAGQAPGARPSRRAGRRSRPGARPS